MSMCILTAQLAQSVLPSLGVGLPAQDRPPQLGHFLPPQHPHHHFSLIVIVVVVVVVIIMKKNIVSVLTSATTL